MVNAELLIIPKVYLITNHEIIRNGLLVVKTINIICTNGDTKTPICPLNRTQQAMNLTGRLFDNFKTYLKAGPA